MYSMHLKKNSFMTPFISESFIKMAETGLLNVYYRRNLKSSKYCKNSTKGSSKMIRSLGIETFVSLFAILLAGFVSSMIIFALELCFKENVTTLRRKSGEDETNEMVEIELILKRLLRNGRVRRNEQKVIANLEACLKLLEKRMHK